VIHKLRKLTRLPRHEVLFLVHAAVLLAPLRLILKLLGLQRTQRMLQALLPAPHRDTIASAAQPTAERAAYLVEVAAKYSLSRPACLERSLTLWALMNQRGQSPVLRIGARKPGEDLDIHAWVEQHQVVINDHRDIAADYAVIAEFAAQDRSV
jgi:hypothetical protein